ncbi:mannose-6-phosphate isomerase [Thioclava sp. SK-1]|uniref:AGE family epimerase/isomerase n=1 Tax=Thioclava sp. SK-1 TaxID=1889770 RepID=UPI0008271689|nr:AGE family epimerase/isomerase [Thioclava sp. SK-1]OCX58188.1 mannose-6-phosphate isomerase [Thioclava sp. SK-1]
MSVLAAPDYPGFWIDDPVHRNFLRIEALAQFHFFRKSLRGDGGFDVLGCDGTPQRRGPQELHTTTRLVHSYALGHAIGVAGSDDIVDAGMAFLWKHHRDTTHGGYMWGVTRDDVADGTKLAYGHMFVLLAASSAKLAGHPDADRLLSDVTEVLNRHYWQADFGLYRDEFTRDWQEFSRYRGMNANMHGVEAHLAAFEATSDPIYLDRAGKILDFFVHRIAPNYGDRLPEHYNDQWQVDPTYAGNPMFRPAGSTPGHSLELGRLCLQHWELTGRPDTDAPARARSLIETAIRTAWRRDGGFAYTLDLTGNVDISDRYWWPVAEGIGAMASLIKLDRHEADEDWYRKFWSFAHDHLIDHRHGGWFPELSDLTRPASHQFKGKPDIYHSVQAALFPLPDGLSRLQTGLAAVM